MGSFPANSLGFHDLGGNVSELAVPEDARPFGDSSFLTNLIRLGGSWADLPLESIRNQPGKSQRAQSQRADAGFRCVLDPAAAAVQSPR